MTIQGYSVKVYPNEGDPFVPDIPVCRPFTEEFAFFIDILLNNKENLENPALLIECGFLTNPDECEKLSEKEYQKQLSFLICCGIIEYIDKN